MSRSSLPVSTMRLLSPCAPTASRMPCRVRKRTSSVLLVTVGDGFVIVVLPYLLMSSGHELYVFDGRSRLVVGWLFVGVGVPLGTEVLAPDGTRLGTTPAAIHLPRQAQPVILTLRAPGFRPATHASCRSSPFQPAFFPGGLGPWRDPMSPIDSMAGPFRLPDALRRADALARTRHDHTTAARPETR